jgi:aminomethyltransferase
MVPFGGFHMPVQYEGLSVGQSHAFTREHSSIFDVSHMAQRLFKGPGAAAFLQRITPSDLDNLPVFRSTLSTLLHADGSGGIVDDTIITRVPNGSFYVVTNAGCRAKDDAYFDAEVAKWNRDPSHAALPVEQSDQMASRGLIALQGPDSPAILSFVLAEPIDLATLYFGHCLPAHVRLPAGGTCDVLISRGGYTGEDGFELSIPGDQTAAVTRALLDAGGPARVQLAGLGARDSLRLEAGMCLYGHDLDDATTPVEAGLGWIVPKARRGPDAGYYGAEVISRQLVPISKGGAGVTRRRVGLVVEGAPAREGAEIAAPGGGDKIGVVTSGCPSPTLGKNIAMGYVREGMHKAGTEVDVLVRGRPRKAVVVKMPFVETKYYKGG